MAGGASSERGRKNSGKNSKVHGHGSSVSAGAVWAKSVIAIAASISHKSHSSAFDGTETNAEAHNAVLNHISKLLLVLIKCTVFKRTSLTLCLGRSNNSPLARLLSSLDGNSVSWTFCVSTIKMQYSNADQQRCLNCSTQRMMERQFDTKKQYSDQQDTLRFAAMF